MVRALDFAQRYAVAIDWTDQGIAQQALEETNAFVPPDEAEETGVRLRLPPAGR